MCYLQIHMQCHDKFFEVLTEDIEGTELLVEDIMGNILLNLFGGGTVDNVTICLHANLRKGLRHCSIEIRAQCPCQSVISLPSIETLPRIKENVKRAIENKVCAVMKELFVSVKVESLVINPSPWDYGSDPALSYST
jgi:hypothetical protein